MYVKNVMQSVLHKKGVWSAERFGISLRAPIYLSVSYRFSLFQIVHAPYAIARYAAIAAIGSKIRYTTPAAIITAPSQVVRSLSLPTTQLISVFIYTVIISIMTVPSKKCLSTYIFNINIQKGVHHV